MNLLIVGSGMYVTGRGGTGMGTLLAAAMQALGRGGTHRITICATRASNDAVVAAAAARIREAIGVDIAVEYEAYDGSSAGLATLARRRAIDAAIVSTPDPLHFEQSKTLIEAGIHLLCVKPLVPTVAEHRTLAELARTHRVHAAVEFHKRWDESNLHMRKAIAEGHLGKLHNFTVDYSQRIVIPTEVFAGWAERTNIFQYLGIHYVDLVQWLTDAVPVRLQVRGTRGALADMGVDSWDSVHVWLVWRRPDGDEFLSQYNLSWVASHLSPAMSDQRFSVLGSRGRYDIDQRDRGIAALLHGEPLQFINPWFSEMLPGVEGGLEMQGYGYKSIACFLRDADDVLNGRIDAQSLVGRRPTFEDCIHSTRVIECVNHCLAQGSEAPVDLSL